MMGGVKVDLKTAIPAAVFAVAAISIAAMPTSYLVQAAGPAVNVLGEYNGKDMVSVQGTKTYPTDSSLFMTTVTSFGNSDTGMLGGKVLTSIFSRDSQIAPVRAYYPKDVSSADIRARNQALMTDSQDSAAVVAFEAAGMDVSMTLTIAQTYPENPSSKVVKIGDVITGVADDGGAAASSTAGEAVRDKVSKVESYSDLSKVLDAAKPGSTVTLRVERAGTTLYLPVITKGYEPDSTGWVNPGALLGVNLSVTEVKLPATVKYVVDGIGGPSAGNMFALGIYDLLTPGSLGGNHKIAGTGTVSFDGDVGPIGGIEHKLQGAAKHGVTDFLAPATNCANTIGFEPNGMNIWAVRTNAEAIKAVEAIQAGDTSALTSCKALVEGK